MVKSPIPIFAKEETAAALMDMTPMEFRSLVDIGALPRPLQLSGFDRWSVAELEAIGSGAAMDDEGFEP